MAGLFQKVWNHTRKDSKSIYGRSSLDAGHRSSHKRPLQYIDEGNFARISSSSPSSLTTTRKKEKFGQKLIKSFFYFLSFQIGDPSQAADEREITPNT